MARGIFSQGRQIRVDNRAVPIGSAIPDTSMFQSPLYQYSAVAGLNATDGETAKNWTEQLAGAGDAAVVNTPVYRANQGGFEAVEYSDADNDAHAFPSDGQLPTGGSAVSIAATIYIKTLKDFNTVISYGGGSSTGDGFALFINSSGAVRPDIYNIGTRSGGSLSTGTWVTVGCVIADGEQEGYANGSSVVTDSHSTSLVDANRSFGYRAFASDFYADIYVYDIVICDARETDQAFSDYHSSRLG